MNNIDTVTFDDVHVQLSGEDGNIFNLVGIVCQEIISSHGHAAGKAVSDAAFEMESYDEVLQYLMRQVHVS